MNGTKEGVVVYYITQHDKKQFIEEIIFVHNET